MKGSIEQLNATILQSSGLLDLFLRGLQNSKFISCNEGRKCIGCLFFFGPVVVQVQVCALTVPMTSSCCAYV